MAKVHPQEASCSSACITYKPGTYTVWMKSLVFHSNGCTVYDSNGEMVYRVDNYDTKGTRQVHLMDLRGRVLCTLHKRILGFGRWDVYRSNGSNCERNEKPWFKVKTCYKMTTGKVSSCKIALGCQKFLIERISGKTAFRILNMMNGETMADAKQKHSCSGIVLGNDVLTLAVVADIDHSLIMAFVTVFGLICGTM